MEMQINGGERVPLNLEASKTSLNVGSPGKIEVNISNPTLEMKMPKSERIAFEFISKFVGGGSANIIRCTLEEFDALLEKDGRTLYAVTTTTDELRQLYLGNTLIAKASDDGGSWGFAYTFPITFGR